MKYTLEKFKLFGKLRRSTQIPVAREFINPERDWSIGLGLAVLCFATGVGYIVFDFYMQFEVPQDMNIDSKGIMYRPQEVEDFAQIFTAKESTFNELRQQVHNIPIETLEGTETGSITEPLAEEESAQ